MINDKDFKVAGIKAGSVLGFSGGAQAAQHTESLQQTVGWSGLSFADMAAVAAIIYTVLQIFVLMPKIIDVCQKFFACRRKKRIQR